MVVLERRESRKNKLIWIGLRMQEWKEKVKVIIRIKINDAKGIVQIIFKISNIFLLQLLGIQVETSSEQMNMFECNYIKYFIVSAVLISFNI